MDTLVKKNKDKKKDVEIDNQEKAGMTDIIERSMENASLKLNGEDEGCRFLSFLEDAIFCSRKCISFEKSVSDF